MTNNDINQISKLLDTKLVPIKKDLNGVKGDLKGVKRQLDTVEMKVEVVNKRVDQLGGQLKQTEQNLEKAITKSQEDTVEVLSDLIHAGYDLHEKRIRKIEDKLQIASPQQ